MASGPGKSEEDIVRSHLRASEEALWWHGEFEPRTSDTLLDKIRSFSRAMAIIPILLLMIFRSEIPSIYQFIILGLMVLLFSWEQIHAWFNKEWHPVAIITDQRVWLPSREIKGIDIAAIQKGFGFNGAITHEIVTRNGETVALPVVDVDKVRTILEKQFLNKGQS